MLQMTWNNGYYEYEYDTFHFLYVPWRVTTCNYCDPCVQRDLGTSLKEMHSPSRCGPPSQLDCQECIPFSGILKVNQTTILSVCWFSWSLISFVMPYIPGWCLIVNIVGSSATVQAQVVRLMKERQWSRKEVPRTPPESLLLTIRMGYDAW